MQNKTYLYGEYESSLEYGTDINTVIEAIDVPEARKISCNDTIKKSAVYYFQCVKLNIFVIGLGIIIIGVYAINSAFYILGMTDPETWTFLDTGVKEGFYTTYCIVWVLGMIFSISSSDNSANYYKLTSICFIIFFLIALPFGLVHHYKHAIYNNLCNDYIYELRVYGNDIYFERNKIYTVSSAFVNNGNSLLISAGPLPSTLESLTSTFGTNDIIVPYNGRLELFGSSILSRTKQWYGPRADFNGIEFMEHPTSDDESKICMNEYGNKTLQITTIIPVLQRRMKTCTRCMEGCMEECKHWSTRTVPTTTVSCDSKGHCTTHHGYRTEMYCSERIPYSECKVRCDTPACIGIQV
mgnify:CR=1 FL=1